MSGDPSRRRSDDVKPRASDGVAILGIDCATKPKKTGLALGHLEGDTVRVVRCATGSAQVMPLDLILEWLADQEDVLLGLDAPLGWPRTLGSRLGGHRAGAAVDAKADALFFRAADLEVRTRFGKLPLAVGADRIARTAVAALELLEGLRRATGRAIPLAWSHESLGGWQALEVYPAATRIACGVRDKGGVLEGFGATLDYSAVEVEASRSVDAADACVCALAAGDFLRGSCVAPDDVETAVTEGWIWVRRASIGATPTPDEGTVEAAGAGGVAPMQLETPAVDGSRAEGAAPSCYACERGIPKAGPRVCPQCGFEFSGPGWAGIDGHWKRCHEDVMSYEAFWESLCPGHRKRRDSRREAGT